MPTILSDPPPILYILLGTAAIILAAVWARFRTTKLLTAFAGVAGLLLLLFLIDRFVESPREQAVRKMKELAAATQSRRMDEAFRHISESFNYHGMSKSALRDRGRSCEVPPDAYPRLEQGGVVGAEASRPALGAQQGDGTALTCP